jgi:CO2 hydration protein
MVSAPERPTTSQLSAIAEHLARGGALIPDDSDNLLEVVGVLKAYAHVLDAYWRNLIYIADHQFLRVFPFFKYFNGDLSPARLGAHLAHRRINYEFAEYCMKAMLWHGGGGFDRYLDSEEFAANADRAIRARFRGNPFMLGLHRVFPGFLPEWTRQMCYYSVLGQFWRVMSPLFFDLSDRYDRGEIRSIPEVVAHVRHGLVAAANIPLIYSVEIRSERYDLLPASAGLTFLFDAAVPYVEAVFFRSLPFMGTVSYNAQARQISAEQSGFNYGVLYADPLPVGGAGIPPTLLMQDMGQHLPDYLREFYFTTLRGEDDLRVQICVSFQKSMCCVTSAAIQGLAPHPYDSTDPAERQANHAWFMHWLDRLSRSAVPGFNP